MVCAWAITGVTDTTTAAIVIPSKTFRIVSPRRLSQPAMPIRTHFFPETFPPRGCSATPTSARYSGSICLSTGARRHGHVQHDGPADESESIGAFVGCSAGTARIAWKKYRARHRKATER